MVVRCVTTALLLLLIPAGLAMCPYNSNSNSKRSSSRGGSPGDGNATSTPLEGSIPGVSDPADPLVRANGYFHDMYDAAQAALVPKVSIMMEGDYLVLHLANGSRLVEPAVHSLWHDLKMVCHMPLGAYTIMLPNVSRSITLPEETLANLRDYAALLANVTLALTQERFPGPGQLERQQAIFSQTVAFVDETLEAAACSQERLASFAWASAGAINLNLEEAAEDTINMTHAVVSRWRRGLLSDADWAGLYTATAVG
jgi:hypothetical protein